MELVEFLRARLDEDEAVAEAARLYEVTATSDLESTYPDLDFRSGRWWATEDRHYDDGLIRRVRAEVESGDDPTYTLPSPIVVSDEDAPEATFRHIARHDPARVLREVEAKRRIIKTAALMLNDGVILESWESVLQDLALPYKDHPDYDTNSEWKPS